MPRVLISASIPADIVAPVVAVAEVDMWDGGGTIPRDEVLARLPACRGWLSMLTDRVDEPLLDLAPDLEVISQMAVGVDNIDVAACIQRGIRVGHTPDVLTETVADTAFALIASALRRLPEGESMVKGGHWGPWDPWGFLGGDLHGARLGIVGMGGIGQALTRRASGFEMTVRYASPSDKQVPGAMRVGMSELLRTCDIVVIAAPLTAQTRGMIGRAELALMRESAILVNIARGPLVDTEALVEALAAGRIAGAALDVTDPEPLPSDHPLLALPNCLIVPHIGSASMSARRGMAALAVDNLVAGLTGRPMPASVNGSAGEHHQ